MGEVAKASASLSRQDANEIVMNMVSRYEGQLMSPPQPKKFRDCYDWDLVLPKAEWFDLYSKVKNELAEMGLKI
jgi:hypothetical protein